jgi:hypothetical protein
MEFCTKSELWEIMWTRYCLAMADRGEALVPDEVADDIPAISGLFDAVHIRGDGVRFYFIYLGTGERKRKHFRVFTRAECIENVGSAVLRAKVLRKATTENRTTAFVTIMLPNHKFLVDPLNLVIDYLHTSKICVVSYRFYSPEGERRKELDFFPKEFAAECYGIGSK